MPWTASPYVTAAANCRSEGLPARDIWSLGVMVQESGQMGEMLGRRRRRRRRCRRHRRRRRRRRRPSATPGDHPRHQHRSKYGSYDPYMAQHRSKYGSYDPNIGQHRRNYGSYDPNIGQHRRNCRKFKNPQFLRKINLLKWPKK